MQAAEEFSHLLVGVDHHQVYGGGGLVQGKAAERKLFDEAQVNSFLNGMNNIYLLLKVKASPADATLNKGGEFRAVHKKQILEF